MFAKTIIAAVAALSFVAAAPALEKKDNTGTATYYAAGLGACGWTNSGSDYIVAMNAPQYDQSKCGSKIWVYNPETSQKTEAQVVDLCPGCSSGDLDLSEGLFGYLTNGNYDQGVFELTWGYL